MSSTRLKKVRSLLIAGLGIPAMSGLLAIGVMPGRAQALVITMNCFVPHDPPTNGGQQISPPFQTCPAGGPFGTVTITNGVPNDPNRVGISWNLTPPPQFAGASLERLLLNVTNPILPNHDLRLMAIPVAPGAQTPLIGTATLTNNAGALGAYRFDSTLTLFASGQNLILPSGTASLGLFNNGPGGGQVPLTDAFFNALTSAATNAPPGTGVPPELLAGYRLNNFRVDVNCEPPQTSCVTEFWAGSSVVPEPASLLLLGTGLVALSGLAARRRAAGKKTPVV